MATERLTLIITTDARGAVTGIESVSRAAKTALPEVDKRAAKAGTSITGIGVAAIAAGGAVLGGMRVAANAFVGAGREVLKLQRVTGGTAEDLSRLRFAAQQSGIGVDQLATGLVRLSRNRSAVEKLGISFEDAAGGARPLTEVLGDVAARFEALPNGAEKNALALRLFGRSGADLIPILNRGRDGIRSLGAEADRLGLVFDQKGLDGVKAYTKAQRELSAAMESFKVQAGAEIATVAVKSMTALADVTKRASAVVSELPDGFKQTAATAATAVAALAGIGGSLALLGRASRFVVSGFESAILAARNLKTAVVSAGTEGSLALTRMGKVAAGLGAAVVGVGIADVVMSAINSVGGLDKKVDENFDRLIAASDKGGREFIRAFAEAARSEEGKLEVGDIFHLKESIFDSFNLAGAGRVVATYGKRVFDNLLKSSPDVAQRLVNELKAANEQVDRNSESYRRGAKLIEEWQAQIDTAKAANAALAPQVDDTTDALGRQGKAVDDNRGRWQRWSDSVADAVSPFTTLMDAQDRLSSAQDRVRAAQERIVELQVRGGKRSEEYAQSVRGLRDAHERLQQAIDSAADAQERLRKAQSRLLGEQDPQRRAVAYQQLARAQQDFDAAREALRGLNREKDADAYEKASKRLADADERLQQARRQLSRIDPTTDPNAYGKALEELRSAQRQSTEADRGVRDAREGVADAQRRVIEESRRGAVESREWADAQRELTAAKRDVGRAALDLVPAIAGVLDTLDKSPDAAQKAVAALRLLRDAGVITTDTYSAMTAAILASVSAAEQFAKSPAVAAAVNAANGGGFWRQVTDLFKGGATPAAGGGQGSSKTAPLGTWGLPTNPAAGQTFTDRAGGNWKYNAGSRQWIGSTLPGVGGNVAPFPGDSKGGIKQAIALGFPDMLPVASGWMVGLPMPKDPKKSEVYNFAAGGNPHQYRYDPQRQSWVLAYSDGGITPMLPAGIHAEGRAPGVILALEPGTGGEAIIPMGSSKRAKALPVLAEVAERFGMAMTRYADGGFTRPVVVAPKVGPVARFADGGFTRPMPATYFATPTGRAATERIDADAIARAVAQVMQRMPVGHRQTTIHNHGVRDADATAAATLKALRSAEFLAGVD